MAKQIDTAVELIKLGARLQVLESETDLSYERLLRLYKEVAGKSPSKGQLPFSTDWFLTWQPNIHASLFLNIYEYLSKASSLEDIQEFHLDSKCLYPFLHSKAVSTHSFHSSNSNREGNLASSPLAAIP